MSKAATVVVSVLCVLIYLLDGNPQILCGPTPKCIQLYTNVYQNQGNGTSELPRP